MAVLPVTALVLFAKYEPFNKEEEWDDDGAECCVSLRGGLLDSASGSFSVRYALAASASSSAACALLSNSCTRRKSQGCGAKARAKIFGPERPPDAPFL